MAGGVFFQGHRVVPEVGSNHYCDARLHGRSKACAALAGFSKCLK